MPLQPFLAIAYVAIALSFAPLGHWVGETLAGDRPLVRYAQNVAGGLAGIAVFAAFSAADAASIFARAVPDTVAPRPAAAYPNRAGRIVTGRATARGG